MPTLQKGPYRKFHLIHGHLRPFEQSKNDETPPIPTVFQVADESPDHIQAVSVEISVPGSHLGVCCCMIRYTGRSNETKLIKGKPDPLGFRIWVIAQQGFFILWVWYLKQAKYGVVGVEQPPRKSSTQGRVRRRGGRARDAGKTAGKNFDIEDKPIAFSINVDTLLLPEPYLRL